MPSHCHPLASLSRIALPAMVIALGGCVHYRYDVTAAGPAGTTGPMSSAGPGPDAQTTVLADRDLVVPAVPARLRLRQVESRCVVLIENPTDAEITLDGQASAIVDPLGQSRAINGQLVPPGAFVKLILPPLRDAPPAGPAFTFGVGVLAATDTPRSAQYLDTGRATDYWEWDGEGHVRLVLTLRQKEQVFRHEFVLTRTKQ